MATFTQTDIATLAENARNGQSDLRLAVVKVWDTYQDGQGDMDAVTEAARTIYNASTHVGNSGKIAKSSDPVLRQLLNCVANNCEDAEGVQYSLKLADRETGSYVVQMKPKKGGDFDYAKLQRLAEELNAMLTTCGKQALAGAKEAEAEVREALGTGSAIPELSAVSSVVSVQVGC